MKPTNRFYGYSPADPPDEDEMVRCTYCGKSWESTLWINFGHCISCQKAYAGPSDED